MSIADAISTKLDSANVTWCMDSHNKLAGFQSHAKESKKVMFLLSKNFVKDTSAEKYIGSHQIYEVVRVRGTLPCIPVRIDKDIDESQVPYGLMQIRHLQYEDRDEFYSKLAEHIRSKCI